MRIQAAISLVWVLLRLSYCQTLILAQGIRTVSETIP